MWGRPLAGLGTRHVEKGVYANVGCHVQELGREVVLELHDSLHAERNTTSSYLHADRKNVSTSDARLSNAFTLANLSLCQSLSKYETRPFFPRSLFKMPKWCNRHVGRSERSTRSSLPTQENGGVSWGAIKATRHICLLVRYRCRNTTCTPPSPFAVLHNFHWNHSASLAMQGALSQSPPFLLPN